jgi:hypothetical protein
MPLKAGEPALHTHFVFISTPPFYIINPNHIERHEEEALETVTYLNQFSDDEVRFKDLSLSSRRHVDAPPKVGMLRSSYTVI